MNFSGAKAFLVLILAGTLLFAIGCADSGSTQLRVLHGSPDAPNVDILYDGKTLLTNVAYSDASAYLKVKAGSRRVEVRVTDRGPFVEGRDIDLSHGVAFKLGLIQRGVAPVLIAQIGEGDIRPILNHFPPQSMLKGSLHKTHSHVGHSGYHGHLLKQSASHLTSKLPVVRTYTLYQPRHPMN